jgi:tetratricopeptide (TPR) repeat protein
MKIASSLIILRAFLLLCFVGNASGIGRNPRFGEQSQIDTSGSPEAREIFDTGRIQMEQGNPRAALDAFEQAVKKDPNFALGWSAAGEVHFGLHEQEQGIEEMKRALALAPKQRLFYVSLATAFKFMKREEDALKVWQQLQEVYPDDPDARKNVGLLLSDLRRYQEAVAQLEAAMNDPDGWKLLFELGSDYARLGQKDKAIAAFQRALEHDSSSDSLNLIAYILTGENMMLDEALRYGQRAVLERESETYHISLQHLTYEDLRTMPGLGGDWDTLGWTHFKMGHIAPAQKLS